MLAANLGQVRPSILYRPMLLSLAGAALVLLALRWGLRDWKIASLLTTLLIMLFYGYGHVYNALRTIDLGGTTLGRHRFLVPVWLLLLTAGAWVLLRRRRDLSRWNDALNAVWAIGVLLPAAQMLWYPFADRLAAESGLAKIEPDEGSSPRALDPSQLPDIYYIILDAYARADTLREVFDYDNSEFLDELRGMGFYIAECSQANYSQTELSLAASLNLGYLDDLVEEPFVDASDRERLWPLIRNSVVRRFLEDLGYRVVAFETGYYWSELEDADVYLAPERGLFSRMTAFEGTLLRSTAAWALIDVLPSLPPGLVRDLDRSADAHRARLQFVFDELEAMPARPGPKFVFAHIVSPHRPFVFDAQGNPVDDDYEWTQSTLGLSRYAEGYRQQIAYLNVRMIQILDSILAESHPPPAILIQSDHGPEEGSSYDRMKILNAYLLWNQERGDLYPQISPVNSFRTVFRGIFGTEFSSLEDSSYFSIYQQPFDHQVIPLQCPD